MVRLDTFWRGLPLSLRRIGRGESPAHEWVMGGTGETGETGETVLCKLSSLPLFVTYLPRRTSCVSLARPSARAAASFSYAEKKQKKCDITVFPRNQPNAKDEMVDDGDTCGDAAQGITKFKGVPITVSNTAMVVHRAV